MIATVSQIFRKLLHTSSREKGRARFRWTFLGGCRQHMIGSFSSLLMLSAGVFLALRRKIRVSLDYAQAVRCFKNEFAIFLDNGLSFHFSLLRFVTGTQWSHRV